MLPRMKPKHSSSENLTETLFDKVNLIVAESDTPSKQCTCHSYRWTVICLLTLGMVIVHAQRINVSVSLLALSHNDHDSGTNLVISKLPQTSWTPLQTGLLHSSFFVGYLITQVPSALLIYQFAPHKAFGIGVVFTCALNLLLPVLIEGNHYALIMTVRNLQGAAEGLLWPSSFVLINNWSAKSELYRVSGLISSGSYAGAIIGFPLCGFITHYAGWQINYYGSGGLGLLWAIFWFLCSYSKPDNHPKITEQELVFINKDKSTFRTSWRNIPWKDIFTSKAVLAMSACGFAKGWVFNLMLMQEPTYLHVFGLTIAEIGTFSAMPFIVKLLTCYASGFIGDFLVNRQLASSTQVRKSLNTLGFGIEAACLFILSFTYGGETAVAILIIGVGANGFSVSGWQTNHLDLAPQYSGVLVALTQCCSNIAGILSPSVAGYFIQQSGKLAIESGELVPKGVDKDIYGWHIILLIASLVDVVCCTFYLICASGKEEPWAKLTKGKGDALHSVQSSHCGISYQTIQQESTDCDGYNTDTDESTSSP